MINPELDMQSREGDSGSRLKGFYDKIYPMELPITWWKDKDCNIEIGALHKLMLVWQITAQGHSYGDVGMSPQNLCRAINHR